MLRREDFKGVTSFAFLNVELPEVCVQQTQIHEADHVIDNCCSTKYKIVKINIDSSSYLVNSFINILQRLLVPYNNKMYVDIATHKDPLNSLKGLT